MAVTRTQMNFASRGPRPVGKVASAIWVLVVIGIATLAAGWSRGSTLGAQTSQMTAHAERLRAEIVQLRKRAGKAPSSEDIAGQAQQVTYLNTLTGERHAPLSDVMGVVAACLSADVRLSQLTYDVETGRLSLSVQSENEQALPQVLHKFETAGALTSVILERQARLQQGGQALGQYDVVAVAK